MARFWIFFLAPGFLVVLSLSRYAFSSLSSWAILTVSALGVLGRYIAGVSKLVLLDCRLKLS